MAKRFLTPVNILNAQSDPGSAAEGDLYYNTEIDKLRIYSNSTWSDVSSGGGGVTSLTGTASEIDVSASVGAIILSLPETINANTTGSAAKLTTARAITLTGDVTGTANFDGSASAGISSTLANSGVSTGTYGSASAVPTLTIDAKGRTTSASATPIVINQSAVTNLTTDLAAKAPLSSPTLTGTPASPTAAADTNTTQIATTAYVVGQAGTANPTMNGAVAVGTSLRYARQDHVHASDTSRAPLNSPTFTGTVTLAQDPTQALHAATKQYVDALAEGLHVHASCATATTTNIANLSSPGASIDGVTLTTNMRVLVKNQSTTSQNGIYVFNGTGLVRASDFDAASEIQGGDFVFITGGTTNDNTGWVQTEIVTTVGTSPIIFTQFSGAGTYTAGTGLALNGNQFSNTGVLSVNGSTGVVTGLATTAGKLSQFAATTSAELAGVVSDETGSGSLVFATAPNFTTDIEVNAGSLSSASTTVLTPLALNATTTNSDYLRFRLVREATGSDWQTAGWKIQRTVDVTNMGYVEFGSTASHDVRIGSNATDIAVFAPTSITSSVPILTPAATTSATSIRIPHGTAPSSPTNGDIWTTTGGLFARINGVTVGPYGIGTARTFYQTTAPSTPTTGDIWVDSDEVYTTINPNDYALKSQLGEVGFNPLFLGGM